MLSHCHLLSMLSPPTSRAGLKAWVGDPRNPQTISGWDFGSGRFLARQQTCLQASRSMHLSCTCHALPAVHKRAHPSWLFSISILLTSTRKRFQVRSGPAMLGACHNCARIPTLTTPQLPLAGALLTIS